MLHSRVEPLVVRAGDEQSLPEWTLSSTNRLGRVRPDRHRPCSRDPDDAAYRPGRPRRPQDKPLRYRLLHIWARITRGQRKVFLRLAEHWPWTLALARAFQRLRRIPLPARAAGTTTLRTTITKITQTPGIDTPQITHPGRRSSLPERRGTSPTSTVAA
jgi:hypothetical protein